MERVVRGAEAITSKSTLRLLYFITATALSINIERNISGDNVKCRHRRFDECMIPRQDDMEA